MKWTENEIIILERDYSNMETRVIASSLGRKYSSVLNKAFALGLKKDKCYLSAMGESLKESGATHRFQKGHTPANKGMKQVDYMTEEAIERTKATRFQKGNLPNNTSYDGAITIRFDHKNKRNEKPYKWIRISQGKWELLHRHLWKQVNGDIPNGYNVVFKNGNTLNCAIENLECISKNENMKRNTIQRYPEELKVEIRKISKIKKLINKIIKQNNNKNE